jgi:hypothetical protein
MLSIKNIVEGYKNVLIKDKTVEQLYTERVSVCRGCSSSVMKLGVATCGECGCPLLAKLRVINETCPKELWK